MLNTRNKPIKSRLSYLIKNFESPSTYDMILNELSLFDLCQMPFGVNFEIIDELQLIALWNHCFGENKNIFFHQCLWAMFISFMDKPSCLLSDCFTEVVNSIKITTPVLIKASNFKESQLNPENVIATQFKTFPCSSVTWMQILRYIFHKVGSFFWFFFFLLLCFTIFYY